MRYVILCLVFFSVGCAGIRFKLDQSQENYNLSTSELLVLDTMDEALNEVEKQIGSEGLPPGQTASLEILGVHSPRHLHPYIRRLLVARLENQGLSIVKEKKVVQKGTEYYPDSDYEYWSVDLTKETGSEETPGEALKQNLLAGADALLMPQTGQLPDLRIVLALRMAGVDVMIKDFTVFEEESLNCRVHAKLMFFGDNTVKLYEGKAESPDYVYRRRLLWFIPIPAPYKELETDRRSLLRKLLDSITGIFSTSQSVAQTTQTSTTLPTAGMTAR